jgi:acetoin utilization protein AcuC
VTGKAAIVHDNALESYGFGGEHPFNPLRLRLTLELCRDLGLLDSYPQTPSEPATDGDLTTVHSLTYVRMVQAAGRGAARISRLLDYGLGSGDNPVFPDMHEACARVVGGVLESCRLVMRGDAAHAMCVSGGLHHAMRSRASGFCVYNDAGVAIARLKEEHPGIRIAYVDTDAHHGDGVQWMFFEDPDVLTVSIHESGRYIFPGRGEVHEKGRGEGKGYSVNVPLQPYTDDDSFIATFETVVPEALRAFGPDLILSQNGCDAHKLDPLTHLSATTRLYEHLPAAIHDLAHELCEGRWVATGGGGYDIWRVVPRAWSALWAAVSHQQLPKEIPEDWLEKWEAKSPVGLPRLVRDDPADYPAGPRQAEISDKNRRTAEEVIEKVLPLIR